MRLRHGPITTNIVVVGTCKPMGTNIERSRRSATTTRGHGRAAFAVGTLHGLAGSSHLLGILPALAMPSDLAAGIYLLLFGGQRRRNGDVRIVRRPDRRLAGRK